MSEPTNEEEPLELDALKVERLTVQSLVVEDASGKVRALVGTAHDSPAVTLFDDKGKPRLALSLNDQGHPSIILFHSDGKPTIQLGESADLLDESGATQLMFYVSGNNGMIFTFGMDSNGEPMFLFSHSAAVALKESVDKHLFSEPPTESTAPAEGYHEGLSLN